MLGIDDQPTIKHAILKRLDKEPGIAVCEVAMHAHEKATPPYIAVGVLYTVDGLYVEKATIAQALFDLPIPFEHSHLLNEIDEVCEQAKAVRKSIVGRGRGLILMPEKQLRGNGRRGNWAKYGDRRPANDNTAPSILVA